MKRWFLTLCFSMSFARAAVITGGDTGNTVPPTDDPGWNRVGRVGSFGSGVYVGNGWVLTANHVASDTFVVDGDATYTVLPGSENTQRIRNLTDTANIDLYMFRVAIDPGDGLDGLGNIPIASVTPSVGSDGTHIGTGEGQTSASATTYFVDTDPVDWVWSTSFFPQADATAGGYTWAGDGSRDTRWDFQRMENNDVDVQLYPSEGIIEGFTTNFENLADYGMSVDNDSGSPIFFKNGSVWELTGIAHSVGTFNSQPSRTSMFGNDVFYSDLAQYRDQIEDIIAIPELSAVALAGILVSVTCAGAWKRKT